MKTSSPTTNPYSILYPSSDSSTSQAKITETRQTNTMNIPNKAPPLWLGTTHDLPSAKEGYKLVQGLAGDEFTMILTAIKTTLANPTNDMRKFVGRANVRKFQQEVQNQDLTMDELQVILSEVIQMKYVQLTGPPY
jgi:hypothetical protein